MCIIAILFGLIQVNGIFSIADTQFQVFTLNGAAMYDLFGDKFDLNHDGRLSAAEHMMDFSVFNYWATDDDVDDVDRDRSSESYFDDDNDFDNSDSDDCDDNFKDDNEEDELW